MDYTSTLCLGLTIRLNDFVDATFQQIGKIRNTHKLNIYIGLRLIHPNLFYLDFWHTYFPEYKFILCIFKGMDRIYSFQIEYLEQWISVVWLSSSSNFGRWTCEVEHSFHLCKSLKISHKKPFLLPFQEGEKKEKTRRDIGIQHPYKEIRNGNLWHEVPSETMFTKRLVLTPSFTFLWEAWWPIFYGFVFAHLWWTFGYNSLIAPFNIHVTTFDKCKKGPTCLLACFTYNNNKTK